MKKFKTQEIIDLLNQVYHEEISFSRMVEIMNEMVSESGSKCVEDIPVRKFQKGDRVRIKEGVSSKTHYNVDPGFVEDMNDLIGKTMIVDRYLDGDNYVACEETEYAFLEDWLEPYVEELKKGDLAIFWDDDKEYATIRFYERLNEREESYRHTDQNGCKWENAIKFESKEQYERLINGEI